MAPTAAAFTTIPPHLLAGSLEFGAADGAVLVRVQPVELGGATFGAARLSVRVHLLGRDLAVAVRICGAQPLDAALNEVGLSDRLGHTRLALGRRSGGRGLCGGNPAQRQQQDGNSGGGECGLHLDGLLGRSRPESIPVERLNAIRISFRRG